MSWDDLSMREKAAMMRVAVKNKIFDIDNIKKQYNSYAEGGNYTVGNLVETIQDPQATLIYNNGVVLPEITVTPNGNYINNSYDNIRLHLKSNRGKINRFDNGGSGVQKKTNRRINNQVLRPSVQDTSFTLPSYTFDMTKPFYEQIPYNPQFLPYEYNKPIQRGDFKEVQFSNLLGGLHRVLKEQQKQQLESLSKLSRQEVKTLQKQLLDEGYYRENIEQFNKTEVEDLQKKLVKKGYLPSNREIDGIVGKKTIKAYEQYLQDTQVDGIVGNKTRQAYKKSLSLEDNQSKDPGIEKQDGCAEWLTKKFDTAVGGSKQSGVILNAWQMPKSIENAGGQMLLNLYDNPEFAEVKNINDLRKVSEKALAENKGKFDFSQLEVGDVVGVYIRGSSSIGKALREGTTYNSHVGIVVDYAEDGSPIVEHKMPDGVRRQNIKELQNKITVVARPKINQANVPTLKFTPKESQYEVDNEKINFSDNMRQYMNSIAGAKDIMQKLFPKADVEEAEKIAIAVQKRETNYMNYSQGFYDSYVRPALKDAARTAMGLDDYTKSSQLAKIKLSSFSPREQKILGLSSLEDLNDPQKAGVAAMYLMCKNYDYMQRLSEKNKDLGMTKQDIIDAVILSYNQGMGKLRSIGFDKYNNKDSSLENLRDLSTAVDIIPDISSSDYRHFAKIGEWAGKVGEYLYYSGEAQKKNSYIYHAKKNFNDYIKRKDGKKDYKYSDVSEENEKKSSKRREGKHNKMYDYTQEDWFNYLIGDPVSKTAKETWDGLVGLLDDIF